MLRPSPMSWRMAGTPSAVAGTLTSRFGSAIRSWSDRADASVAAVSRARAGETSRETKPSPPFDSSYSGRNTSSAPPMSWITSSQ